jgi:hypothetical protein
MNEKEFKNLDYEEWHIGVVRFVYPFATPLVSTFDNVLSFSLV